MDMASVISLASGNIFSSSRSGAHSKRMNSSMYRVVLVRLVVVEGVVEVVVEVVVVVEGLDLGLFFVDEVLVVAAVAMVLIERQRIESD